MAKNMFCKVTVTVTLGRPNANQFILESTFVTFKEIPCTHSPNSVFTRWTTGWTTQKHNSSGHGCNEFCIYRKQKTDAKLCSNIFKLKLAALFSTTHSPNCSAINSRQIVQLDFCSYNQLPPSFPSFFWGGINLFKHVPVWAFMCAVLSADFRLLTW